MALLALRLVVVLGACWLMASREALAEPTRPTDDASAASSSNDARAANWVHVDPQTGQRLPPTARSVAVPAQAAFSSSHSGLVEEPAPGGGMMIDLQGRFRSAATATVGTDGRAHPDCVPPGAAARRE